MSQVECEKLLSIYLTNNFKCFWNYLEYYIKLSFTNNGFCDIQSGSLIMSYRADTISLGQNLINLLKYFNKCDVLFKL